ncbi:MAG: alpha/beta hydrolase [Pseudomonadota bacterium]
MLKFTQRNRQVAQMVTLLALFGVVGATRAQALELTPCRIDGGSALPTAEALCGQMRITEDRTGDDGAMIELEVALIPALSVQPQPDPLVFFAGGPGQAAIETYLLARGAFERIRQHRAILLVDQRGTGGSNRMSCPMPPPEEMADIDLDDVAPMVRECLDQLAGDPRFYTTSVAVQDIDAIRQALGYEQINLWGGSYGTRVALHYLRQYPQHTRSVIIDGVAPADLSLGPDIALDAQDSADALFDRCTETPACNETFGDLAAKLTAVKARLQDAPVTIVASHPRTGLPNEQIVNADLLAGVVRLAIYSPATRAVLPTIIDRAHAGDYTLIAAQAAMLEDGFVDSMAIGKHNAVVCTEDVPFFDTQTNPALDATFMGSLQVEVMRETCKHWPAGVIDGGFKQPVTSDIPVLLLSGEVDPVTPPKNAERALRTLSRAKHIVAPGQGHIVSGAGCMPKIMGEFVATLDLDALDASCIERLRSMPIFVGPAGPTP